MVMMPLIGYLRAGAATNYFFIFEIPRFADTYLFETVVSGWMGLTFDEFRGPIRWVHNTAGAYLVWVIILVHAAAALYHHYVCRDRVLKRMVSTR